jgi:hypothetical protein
MKTFLIITIAVLLTAGMICPQTVLAWDTENFDGGSGSTINTDVDTSSSSVPDVGPSGPVGYYDENMEYHSY